MRNVMTANLADLQRAGPETAHSETAGPVTEVHADEIPALQHEDAPALATAEFARVLALLESLGGDDWEQPTYCTAWNVQDIAAHLAGAVAGYASWGEFQRQFVTNGYTRSEEAPVDGVNRRQIEDRAGRSPAELIQEFRAAGPKAVRVRHRIPRPLRNLPILRGEPVSDPSLDYLLDVVYTRDWWMHRYDICAATGREMAVDAVHDGRVVELILRDVAYVLSGAGMGLRSVVLILEGEAGGAVRFGAHTEPNAVVRMGVFDFALRTSGRIGPKEAHGRSEAEGDMGVVEWFLNNCEVLY